jgi:CheY-like chemotaxis protein
VSVLNGLRLLVVEDESHVAMLVEDMLADMGCDVVARYSSSMATSRHPSSSDTSNP